jgi:homoserine O-acetyltransferase
MIKNKIKLETTFCFEAGGTIEGLEVTFHTSEKEFNEGDKVIWVCHALTANSDPEEWWPQLVGPGRFLDTEKYFIVCVNMLGTPYGTSGPASVNPQTGKPYRFDFPTLTVRDTVKVFTIVRKHLGIKTVDLLIGSSIGGFHASEWCVMEPDVIVKAVLIATDVRASAWLGASCEAQRMALEADQTFRSSDGLDGGKKGLMCARAQALISYRSYDGYVKTQSESDPDTLMATRVASYERYQGEKLARRYDAYSYWYLCNVLDTHNIGRGRGGVEAALSTIKAETLVVSIDSDCLFPARCMEVWAGMIPGVAYRTIRSDFGHDGFLLENDQLQELLRPLLP